MGIGEHSAGGEHRGGIVEIHVVSGAENTVGTRSQCDVAFRNRHVAADHRCGLRDDNAERSVITIGPGDECRDEDLDPLARGIDEQEEIGLKHQSGGFREVCVQRHVEAGGEPVFVDPHVAGGGEGEQLRASGRELQVHIKDEGQPVFIDFDDHKAVHGEERIRGGAAGRPDREFTLQGEREVVGPDVDRLHITIEVFERDLLHLVRGVDLQEDGGIYVDAIVRQRGRGKCDLQGAIQFKFEDIRADLLLKDGKITGQFAEIRPERIGRGLHEADLSVELQPHVGRALQSNFQIDGAVHLQDHRAASVQFHLTLEIQFQEGLVRLIVFRVPK